jgi:parallel beta-helix repeat protein
MLANIIFAVIGTVMISSFAVLPALAEIAETRGLRPEVVYGNAKHYVTLTFYLGQNDTARLSDILDILQASNVSKAVFFLHPNFASSNPALANGLLQRGYMVLPWVNAAQYGNNYSPSTFNGILLSDRSILTRVDKMADVMAFYNVALHSGNASVVAFTPSAPPRFNATSALLEQILDDRSRTLTFVDDGSKAPLASMGIASSNTTAAVTPVGTNTTSSIEVSEGIWDMQSLQARYPDEIRQIETSLGMGYLVNTTIIVGQKAQLNITNEKIFISSPPSDKDRRIEVTGRASISNSLISSWDTVANAPDANSYHQRPFIFVDGGQINIINSTITHMGFPLAGFSTERSARAAIMFQDSNNFTITNSTIAFDFDGIYARNSSNFKITGNDIFANTRSGIDIRTGSHNFTISTNHVHDNGYEGIICTECMGVTIAGNTVEHNEEAGIKLASYTNFTTVNDNTARYNEKFGIYLKAASTLNRIVNNTITESEQGITLTDSSNNNTISGNVVTSSDIGAVMDPTSKANQLSNNRLNETASG